MKSRPSQASISHQGASPWPLQTSSPLVPTVANPALADRELPAPQQQSTTQAQDEWPRGQGVVGAQQTGGASLWATARWAITHPSFPKPSPHPSGTQWPHIPPAPLNWSLHLWGRQAPSCPGEQVCRRPSPCSSTLPQFPRLLGDPALLSKSAGCSRAFPHAGAGSPPPPPHVGRAVPQPSPHVRCRGRPGLH